MPTPATSTASGGVRRDASVVAVTAAVVLAVGLLSSWSALDATAAVLGGIAAVLLGRSRSSEPMLHALVVSIFLESVMVGPLPLGRLAGVLVLLALAIHVMRRGARLRALRQRSWLPGTVLLLWALASALWAVDFGSWVFAIAQLCLGLVYFLTFAVFLRDAAQLRRLLATYVLASIATGLVSLQQAASGLSGTGLQGDRNFFSMYVAAGIPAAVMLARGAGSGRARTGWLLAVIPLVAAVFASDSRGGLLAAALALVLLVLRGDLLAGVARRGAARAALALGVVGAAVGAGLLLNNRFDLSYILKDRASGRLDIWFVAVHSAQAHPLLGLGGGGFATRSIHLLQVTPGVQLVQDHIFDLPTIEAHNVYLQALTDYGAVGLVLWLVLLATTARILGRAARRLRTPAVAALLPMLVVFAFASVALSVMHSKLLWTLVGLAAALDAHHRRGLPAVSARPSGSQDGVRFVSFPNAPLSHDPAALARVCGVAGVPAPPHDPDLAERDGALAGTGTTRGPQPVDPKEQHREHP